MAEQDGGARWLVLIYQFSRGPGARRVKIWRRLQDIGALAIKNSVYVLPLNEQSREDFEWLLAELVASGAEAALLEARFVAGLEDPQIRERFNAARDAEYAQLSEEVQAVERDLAQAGDAGEAAAEAARRTLRQVRRRFAEIEALDCFAAAGHEAAQAAVLTLEARLIAREPSPAGAGETDMKKAGHTHLRNRVWVTRRNIRVDRIASAWLIRRWIDPQARFKFVVGKDYVPEPGELRFDMFDAEFTHDGDQCTFEVLLRLLPDGDPALQCVAEVVHDIDLKDHKFGRPETEGIAGLLTGLAAGLDADEDRLEQGASLFENLYTYYQAAAQ